MQHLKNHAFNGTLAIRVASWSDSINVCMVHRLQYTAQHKGYRVDLGVCFQGYSALNSR